MKHCETFLLHGFLGAPSDWDELLVHMPGTALAYPFSLDKLPSPFTLIGYSMGGRIALDFAIKNPEKIVSLILISAHLGLKTDEERKKRLQQDLLFAEQLETTPFSQALERWYDQPLFASLKQKRDMLAMRSEQNPFQCAAMLRAHSLGLQPDYSYKLPKQTTLIAGEYDTKYRKHYETWPHQIVEGAGHAIHLEEPKRLAQTFLLT